MPSAPPHHGARLALGIAKFQDALKELLTLLKEISSGKNRGIVLK